MPELPEVETLKLGLQKYIINHKILDVDVKVAKIFQGDKEKIIGAKIIGVKRVGKGLIIELDNKFCLAVHLKMTGQIIYQGKETKGIVLSKKTGGNLPSKYSHVIFTFNDDAKLYFNDLRKFGWIKILKRKEVEKLPFFSEMGPEPYEKTDLKREILSLEKFKEILSKSNLVIKVLLMDQKKIGGIGNIYANEALFLAKINPKRKAKELKRKEVEKLFKAIFTVIRKGIKYGGSSDENFINVLGLEGKYQNHFLVYNRKGQNCVQCNKKILKIKLGQRGTYYCNNCQK